MADTVREKIFQNLKTSLEAITTGNGFVNTIAEVRRYDINDESLGPYPLIVIQPGEETGRDDEGFPLMSIQLDIVLEAWISPAADETRPTDQILNSILGDIKKKLMQDITRGGYAIDTTVGLQVSPFESIRGQAEAGYFITVRIDYRHNQLDPTQAM